MSPIKLNGQQESNHESHNHDQAPPQPTPTEKGFQKTENNGREVLPLPAQINIRQILAPTDFSPASNVGVSYAAGLAQKLGAAVTLIHVLEPLPASAGIEGFLFPAEAQLAKEAHLRLKVLAQQQATKHLRPSTSLLTGKAFHAITVAAGERAADLIVMASHGYTGLDHLLLGSTAERVARHAPCSVLIVPARAEATLETMPQSLKLTRLLVPIDFSDLSKLALPWAAFLARSLGAELVLLHVVEKYPLDHLMGPELMNQAMTPLLKEAEAALQRLADNVCRATGTKTSVLVRDGTPYKEVCQAAQDCHADLVALTTHGYTGLKHVWLGSTAERVARHAACPVLIVRQTQTPSAPTPERCELPDES